MKLRFWPLILAALVLFADSTSVAQNLWKSASGSPVGAIQAFAIDRLGNVLAATSNSLYRSSDNGKSWVTVNSNKSNPNLSLLVADSSGNLYSNGDGVMRSTDNGISWTSHRTGLGDTNYGIWVYSMACMGNGVVFAGTDVGSYGNGLYKSTDFGDSWTKQDTFFHHSIAADPNGNVFVTSPTGILRSSDTGKTWQPANVGLYNRSIVNIVATKECVFAFDDTDSYLDGIIYKSTDEGNSWNKVSGVRGLNSIVSLDSVVLWGGTNTLGYATLTKQANVQTVYNGTYAGILSVLICPNGRLLASTSGDGFYASEDSGSSWHQAQTGLWGAVMPLTIAPNEDVYGGGNGVYRTSDLGDTWERVDSEFSPNGLDPEYPYSDEDPNVVDVTLNQDGHIFVNMGRSFRSTNNGQSWIEVDSGLYNSFGYLRNTLNFLTIDPQGFIFGGTYLGGMFRTSNEGDTWEWASSGVTDSEVTAIAASRSGILYALTWPGLGDGSIFRSENDGQTWINVCPDLTHKISSFDSSRLTSIVIAPNGSVFVGTSNAGLFRSTDSGNTWISLFPSVELLLNFCSRIRFRRQYFRF